MVVVGGGITGLSAAYTLTLLPAATRPEVTLLEADGRLGGKVMTLSVGGMQVEAGPDAFLTRTPAAVDLCRRLGLAGHLVAPSQARASIWSRGRLRPMPKRLVLGVPASMTELARSGILSWRGLARAALEPVLPASRTAGDRSVADLVIPRFGKQVFERLVDPLLSGVYAGRADRLSAEAVTPQLMELARANRSLLLALHRLPKPQETQPAFNTLSGGLGTMVTALGQAIRPAADVRTGVAVSSIQPDGGGGYAVQTADDVAPIKADAVIVAAPAHAAVPMLVASSRDLSAELGAINYASVATVALVYPREALSRPFDGTGFLVSSSEGRLVVGSTWVTAKWPHLDFGDRVVIRCALGRAGDDRWQSHGDPQLVDRVHAELVEAMSLRGSPSASEVVRWPAAMPQYEIGHAARLLRIEEHVNALPGLFLAGAAYRGIGLPACIQQGREAAEKVGAFVSADLEVAS